MKSGAKPGIGTGITPGGKSGARPASRPAAKPGKQAERGDRGRYNETFRSSATRRSLEPRAAPAAETARHSLPAGTRMKLRVAREVAPNGYYLTNGEHDVLLHYSEVEGKVRVGDEVDVFLFYDTEDRLAATMKKPLLTLGEVGLLEVAEVHPRYGCFLEMGLGRQLLLPVRELPEAGEVRPKPGDRVYVVMAHDRQGRLIAKAAGEKDLAPLAFPAPDTWKNTWQNARVYKPLQMGTFVVVEGGVVGFGAIGMIHAADRTRPLRLGEEVSVRVSFVREDGRVNLSMRQVKEVGRDEDAERLLAFLRERPNGAMPYSDVTPADVISKRFGISKAAFKRALGKLLKEGLIEQRDSWTHLKVGAEDTASKR